MSPSFAPVRSKPSGIVSLRFRTSSFVAKIAEYARPKLPFAAPAPQPECTYEEETVLTCDDRNLQADVVAVTQPKAGRSILAVPAGHVGTSTSGVRRTPKKRVRFHPGVLMWSAAEEGDPDMILRSITAAFEYDAATTKERCPSPYTCAIDYNISNHENVTLLHLCCYLGATASIRLLLQLGADPNQRDKEGWTPLHVAAACNNHNVVAMLLSSGADAPLQNSPDAVGVVSVTHDSRIVRLVLQHRRSCEKSERTH